MNVVIESVYEGAAFDYKLYSGDTFIAGLTDSSDSLTVVDFTTIDATKRITATRKRVLYTGDADKLTDAQKDLLNNLEGGKIVIVTDGYGLTVKDESNGDSGIPVLNIGDKDGTVTYGAVLRVNGVAHDPASASESSVVISGATTDYVEDVGHVEMPPSIKIGGKEVATVDQLREKADEFTEWDFGDVGSERGFHVKVERTSEEEYPPAMRYRFTLLDYDDGEERTIDTIYEGSDDIVSIEFQDEVSTSLIYATRKRVLRTGDASFASIPSATSTSDVVSCFNQLLAALKGTSPST
ncbi:MAG: hypothetical protein MJZ81_07245 [Bacteroidales bacterium]|nr:hypothetical protein [Bacteroidales bacterium]